jgi:hypothetical protein
MSRRLAYLVSFVLGLMAVPVVTHAQVENLMHTDPSFEDEIIIVSPGWASWTTWGGGGSVEIDTTDFIDGAKSLRVNQTSGQFNVIAAAIPMTPGDRYTCSFWAKADAPRPISVRFQSMNNSGFVAGDFDLTTEWAEYTFTEEAPNPNNNIKLQFITNDALGISYWLDFVFCYAGESVSGIEPSGLSQVKAADPDPADGAADVPRDVALSWTPGEYANTHDVYFGNSFEDVNAATNLDPMGSNQVLRARQDADSYAVDGRLGFGQTYYWRIDEVNAPPNATIVKGDVWSFTAEPEGVPLTSDLITATASSVDSNQSDPNATVNRAGLDEKNLHNDEKNAMWLCSADDPVPWIQYDFDKAYKLHEMKVWNHNSDDELTLGYGIQQARIEISVDGETWTELDSLQTFNRAPGAMDYAANTTVSLGGVIAQSVRITALSNWSPWPEFITQKGLSEVQFSYIPVWARKPDPDSGATDMDVDVTLGWRAGREAARHDVYLGTDATDLPLIDTVQQNSYDPDALDLQLGQTYFWKINEVNEAETPSSWESDTWSFSTPAYLIVDDFEGYDDDFEGFNRIFQVWIDGFGYTEPAPGNAGNGSGSLVGTDMAPWVELNTVHGGNQAMPLGYDNSVSPFFSETERTFTPAQDWTAHGVRTLSWWCAGDGANVPGQLYVKVNGVQVNYDGDAGNLTLAGWQIWNIDLTAINTNLSNVTSLTIGIQGPGAIGTLLFDDIRLYAFARQLIIPVQPGNDNLLAHYTFDGDFTDVSGNGLHGTAIANPTIANDPVRGQVLSLDGFSALDLGASEVFNFQGSFSISVWANIGAFTNNWSHVIISKRGENDLGWQLRRHDGNPNLTFTMRGTAAADDPRGNVDMTPLFDQWIHITAVYDMESGARTVYVNGLVDVSVSDSGVVAPTTHNTYIGARANSSNDGQEGFLTGSLDELRIYDRALTQEDVTWLAGRTKPFDKPF